MLVTFQLGFAQCNDDQKKMEELEKKYTRYFADLEHDGLQITKDIPDSTENVPDGGHKVRFNVTFKRRDFALDLVSVTMKNRSMIMKIPEVTMKTKSFSVPYTKIVWKTKYVLGIPHYYPQVTTGMKKASFKSPETTMKNKDFTIKVPEFKKQTTKFSFNVPQFTMVSPIKDETNYDELEKKTDDIKKRADSLMKKTEHLGNQQKEEVRLTINSLYDCMIANLDTERQNIVELYTQNTAQIEASIAEMTTNKIDPTNIKSDDGSVVNLISVKEELLKEKANSLLEIDNAISELKKARETTTTEYAK